MLGKTHVGSRAIDNKDIDKTIKYVIFGSNITAAEHFC